MTLIKILFNRTVLIILLAAALATMCKINSGYREENKRISENYRAAAGETEDRLELTRKEFREALKKDSILASLLRDSLKIKVKQVEELSKISGSTKIEYIEVLRDTLIYETDTVYPAKTFSFSDKWISSRGIITGDSVRMGFSTRDTLTVVDHWYKNGKWFLPRLFEKKKHRTSIAWQSPYGNYAVEQHIEVLKRRD